MTEMDLNTIGSRLKFVRKQKRLSQEEMADLIDISISSYRRYETNQNNVPHTTIEKISKNVGISLDFLINGENLVKKKEDAISNIRHNTNIDTKIDNGDMVITARIPLFKHVSQ